MKNFKIQNRLIHLNVEVPFEVGQVKGNAIVMVCFDNSRKPDVDYADIENVTYMDMPIEGYAGWKKLREFHEELGIDLNKLIESHTKTVLTDSVLKEIVSKYN